MAVLLALPMGAQAQVSRWGQSDVKADGPRPGQEWPFMYPNYGVGLCLLKCGDLLKVCNGYATNAWGRGDCRQRHSVCEGDCSIHPGPDVRRP